MSSDRFSRIFEPLQVGPISIRNRVMMPAMATCFATGDGQVTDQMIRYYARRAEGGAGLIIVEATCVDTPTGLTLPHELCIDKDRYIPGLRRLAEGVKKYGARIAIQLHHAGPKTHYQRGGTLVAPSVIPGTHGPVRELSREEIHTLVAKFALGAKRAGQAG